MPNIKPVTDLENYDEVLKDISADAPVFLTVNGRGRYVTVDMEEYERQNAILKLMSELAKSEEAAAKGEIYSLEEVDRELGLL